MFTHPLRREPVLTRANALIGTIFRFEKVSANRIVRLSLFLVLWLFCLVSDTTALPSGVTSQDIGGPSKAGGAVESTGTYTVQASGSDIYGNSDQFHFVHRTLTGNGQIIARVQSLTNTNAWAKAGVMMRETLGAGSNNVMALISRHGQLRFQRRTMTNESTIGTGGSGAAPEWVKLVRTGNTFTSFTSNDGTNWIYLGTTVAAWPDTIYVGLAVTSHNNDALCTAVFDEVTWPSGARVKALTPVDVGSPSPAGSTVESSGTFTIQASGLDIFGSSDQFHFAYQELNGDGQITARLASVQRTDDWSKAGVMIRESLEAGSRYAGMLVSAHGQRRFQRRHTTGLATTSSGGSGWAPDWVRVVRTGNIFKAYVSEDGVNWTLVGSDTVLMGSKLYIGLCVTSHKADSYTTAVFDNVSCRGESVMGLSSSGEAVLYDTHYSLFPKLDLIGVEQMRVFSEWHGSEPSNNTWNFSWTDGLVSDAVNCNFKLTGIIAYSAGWAAPTQKTFPMNNLSAWSDYVSTVVALYSNTVNYWEAWNEPNDRGGTFNQGHHSPYDYATLARLAYNAAHAANPSARMGLTVATFDVPYLNLVLESLATQGQADAFDSINVHPYELTSRMNAPDGELYYLNIVPTLRKMLMARAPASKLDVPIRFTELGVKLNDPAEGEIVDQNLAAELLIKAYTLGIVQGAECVQWFEAKDGGGSDNHGLMGANIGTERVAYHAYRTLTNTLGSHPEYKGWVALGPDGKGYGFVFKGAGGVDVLAAWMPRGSTSTLNFGTTVQVMDIYNATASSSSSISLTEKPVLIKNIPNSWVTQASANIDLPYPWGSTPVSENLVRIRLGETLIQEGLELAGPYGRVPNGSGTNGILVNTSEGGGGETHFCVVPSFADFNTNVVHIRVTARRQEPGDAGMNLWYQPNGGTATWSPQNPYKNAGTWKSLPSHTNSATFTWTITDAMFANTFGYSFALRYEHSAEFILEKVELSKIPFL